MRPTFIALLLLLATAATASAATPMSEIRAGGRGGCEVAYAVSGSGSSPEVRKRACVRVWRCFDRQLSDHQIRVWYGDIRAERDPVRYQDVMASCMAIHRPSGG